MEEGGDNGIQSGIQSGVAGLRSTFAKTKNTQSTGSDENTVEKLSLKLLEQTQLTNELQQEIANLNKKYSQQKQLLIQARKEKHEADLEVTRLSSEIEDISADLFEQANLQVREAKIDADETEKMNERLSNTIKEKNTTIEILQIELSNLKSLMSKMMDQKETLSPHLERQEYATKINSSNETAEIPSHAKFCTNLLSSFNEKTIYSPMFNQIRFDLPAFETFKDSLIDIKSSKFDILSTKFYAKLIDELDETLRLDKAPSLQSIKLRWNRKTFLRELTEKAVTIEPLSAATESWKSQTLHNYVPASSSSEVSTPEAHDPENMPSLSRFGTSNTVVTSYDPSLFKNVSDHIGDKGHGVSPLAVTTPCGLCGEQRRDMNFSRLYHLRIEDSSLHKSDFALCINCANKYRVVVDLLKFVYSLNSNNMHLHSDIGDFLRWSWANIVNLKAKVWYAVNIGIWSEKELFGLVYGWQNDWLVSAPIQTNTPSKSSRYSITETCQTSSSASAVYSNDTKSNLDNTKRDSYLQSPKGKGWAGWTEVVQQTHTEKSVTVSPQLLGLGPRRSNVSLVSDKVENAILKSQEQEVAVDAGFEDAVENVDSIIKKSDLTVPHDTLASDTKERLADSERNEAKVSPAV